MVNVGKGQVWPHSGGGDTETNAVAHALPVVAMLAGHPEMLQAVNNAVRVTQDNDAAAAFGLTFARYGASGGGGIYCGGSATVVEGDNADVTSC